MRSPKASVSDAGGRSPFLPRRAMHQWRTCAKWSLHVVSRSTIARRWPLQTLQRGIADETTADTAYAHSNRESVHEPDKLAVLQRLTLNLA